MVPLFIIFLVHNYILIPQLIKKGYTARYGLSILVIILLYAGALYAFDMHRPHRIEDIEPRHSLAEKDGHLPPHSIAPRPPHIFDPGSPPDRDPHNMKRPPHPFPFHILFKLFLAIMVIGANVAICLIFTYNQEKDKLKDLENFKLQEELKYLKQQISPHFLMNVLNNIYEMAEEDSKTAQEMILELSNLMRYVLYESENGITSLSKEAKFISNYVALMKRRYIEDMVKINLDLSEQVSHRINIPPMLLISFIENAFKHGVSYLHESFINVRLYDKDGKVHFSCENSIPPQRNSKKNNGGIGLTNVKRRLDLLYGDNYSLHISDNDKIYSVKLIIPSL